MIGWWVSMQQEEKNEIVKSELLVITGLSGAGKSVVIQSLEDLGYFCVDNLPPILLPKFIELMEQGNPTLQKVAIGIDLRGREFFKYLVQELDDVLSRKNVITDVLFVDATTEKLISRYKETRRRHPLQDQNNLTLVEAISEERNLLSDIRSMANYTVDTTHLSPKELRTRVYEYFNKSNHSTFTISVQSFGFKHGIQIDADLVFDVRFLPNPYYVKALRPQTGMDEDVYNYVMKWKETNTFYEKLLDLLLFMIPGYKKEGKSQLVIAFGCTGGQHRSVALAQRLSEDLKQQFDYDIHVHHRDAHLESGDKHEKN